MNILREDDRFATLVTALTRANLSRNLGCNAQREECVMFSLVAPTEDAFAALDARLQANGGEPANLNDLLRSPADIVPIMEYHLMEGQRFSEALGLQDRVPTVEGRPLLTEMRGRDLYLTGVPVVQADILATNGVLHVVDEILMPPSLCVGDIDCVGEEVCGIAGFCVVPPPAATCSAPIDFLSVAGLDQPYIGDTSENAIDEAFNYNRGSCGGRSGFENVLVFQPELAEGEPQNFCLSTRGSRFDTVLYVRRQECNNVALEAYCNEDYRAVAGGGGASAVSLRAQPGVPYYLFVDGYSAGERGEYTLAVTTGTCEENLGL